MLYHSSVFFVTCRQHESTLQALCDMLFAQAGWQCILPGILLHKRLSSPRRKRYLGCIYYLAVGQGLRVGARGGEAGLVCGEPGQLGVGLNLRSMAAATLITV